MLGDWYSRLFSEWEKFGRGWLLADKSVEPEPPFIAFQDYLKVNGFGQNQYRDDGKIRSPLGKAIDWIKNPKKKSKEVQPNSFDRNPFVSLVNSYPTAYSLRFPRNYRPRFDEIESLLLMLSESKYPLSFEIVADGEKITLFFTAQKPDAPYLYSQLQAFFPDSTIQEQTDFLEEKWPQYGNPAIVDMGLSDAFMLPLAVPKSFQPDPLIGIYAILDSIQTGELGMLQVIFQGTLNPWVKSVMYSVTDGDGKSVFNDMPEMVTLAEQKTSRPLFGVIVRLIGYGQTDMRSASIVKQLSQSLQPMEAYRSNKLIPLSNEGYPYQIHEDNVFFRTSNRLGMLLNSQELVALVHPPDASVQVPSLRGIEKNTQSAPHLSAGAWFHLGTNVHHGITKEVKISEQDRLRHLHIIGATGTGKSTLIRYLVQQDMEQNQGLAVLDPHGDLIEQILERIPSHRLQDVVVIDPADAEYPVGINLLQAHSELEKIVLSSDLVSVFRRMSTSWGDQMTTVLANAINAFLESSQEGTLLDLKRFLVEESFRKAFLRTVQDEEVVYFWKHEFPLLRGNTIASLITRLNSFLRPKPIRNMMAQKEGVDFGVLMDQGKIILAKLSQGIIGEENSYLLGTLIVAKLQQAAQARQRQKQEERRPFYLYMDEFQHFVTPSMSTILSGSRKYGLGLVLAHQGMHQLLQEQGDIGNAVLANVGTRISFCLGDQDAKKLESSFSHFSSEDLQQLGVGEAIARLGQADRDCNLQTPLLPKITEVDASKTTQTVLELSRKNYAGSPHEPRPLPLQQEEVKEQVSPAEPPPAPKVPSPKIQTTQPKELGSSEKPDTPDMEETKNYLVQQERKKEHKRIQIFVKKLAEARGFKAIIEAPVGKGRVDVLLEHKPVKIGVEISVTNTKEYEVQNIKKCLQGGLGSVLVLSKKRDHLNGIETQAQKLLSKADFGKTAYLHPDELAAVLNTIASQFSDKEKRIKGYKVKTNYSNRMGGNEAANRISEILLRSVGKPPKS